jgi:hypothetical protein
LTELLLALAAEARRREEALEAVLAALEPALVVRREPGSAETVVDRDALLRIPPALRGEALRRWSRELGAQVPGRGIAPFLGFVERAESGRTLVPAPGIRIERNFGELRLVRSAAGARPAGRGAGRGDPAAAGRVLRIPGREHPGEGVLRSGAGDPVRVAWGPGSPDPGWGFPSGAPRATFPGGRLRFPLEFRGRRPGDRVRWRGGGAGPATRRLKKLLGEARVSREQR